jgi:hypothetical protein
MFKLNNFFRVFLFGLQWLVPLFTIPTNLLWTPNCAPQIIDLNFYTRNFFSKWFDHSHASSHFAQNMFFFQNKKYYSIIILFWFYTQLNWKKNIWKYGLMTNIIFRWWYIHFKQLNKTLFTCIFFYLRTKGVRMYDISISSINVMTMKPRLVHPYMHLFIITLTTHLT